MFSQFSLKISRDSVNYVQLFCITCGKPCKQNISYHFRLWQMDRVEMYRTDNIHSYLKIGWWKFKEMSRKKHVNVYVMKFTTIKKILQKPQRFVARVHIFSIITTNKFIIRFNLIRYIKYHCIEKNIKFFEQTFPVYNRVQIA